MKTIDAEVLIEPQARPRGSRVNVKSVALPSEHGGWSFLLEPILLGLLIAGSWQGLLSGIAALGVFLIHQPLKIAVKDRRKGNVIPRTLLAERFVIGYGLLAVIPMLMLILTQPMSLLLSAAVPIALAIPAAGVQLYFDARNQSRKLWPELAGAAALAMIAPAIAVLGGWQVSVALILWVIVTARALPAILYVRTRLKVEHGKPADTLPAVLSHGVALILIFALAVLRVVPVLTILPFVVLAGRAWLGLSRYRTPRPAKIIGFQEIAYGLLTVMCTALGYALSV